MGKQQSKRRGPQNPRERPELNANMVRELQGLRQRQTVLERERDSAVASEKKTMQAALTATREYSSQLRSLCNFVEERAPEVLEEWHKQDLAGKTRQPS